MKAYDERYFKRWYRSRSRIVTAAERTRRIAMVVTMAEFILGRRLRSVLDIGCGEAPWQPVLRRLRPRAIYVGMDSSDYAVTRFGKRRGIVRGSFSRIDAVLPQRLFDLVVASDVIHYVRTAELERGMPHLARRVGGIAYLDFFTSADAVEGDLREMKLRSPSYYLRLFGSHDLHPIGMQFFATGEVATSLTAMEKS